MGCVLPILQEAKKEEVEKPKEAPAEEKPKEAAAPAAEEKPKDAAPAAEEKPKEGGGEEKKEEAPPPPPPEEVEMRVYMHCEGCARKVKKILRRLDGNAAALPCLSSSFDLLPLLNLSTVESCNFFFSEWILSFFFLCSLASLFAIL